jgi:hypothetical protein
MHHYLRFIIIWRNGEEMYEPTDLKKQSETIDLTIIGAYNAPYLLLACPTSNI